MDLLGKKSLLLISILTLVYCTSLKLEIYWESQLPGKIQQASIGSDGTIMGVNSNDEIWLYNGNTWIPIGDSGRLSQISVRNKEEWWGIGKDQNIWKYAGQWIKIPEPAIGEMQQVSVGSDEAVWGVSTGSLVWQYNGETMTWKQIYGPSLSQISVGSYSQVCGVGTNEKVYQWDGSNFNDIAGGNKFKYVDISASGDIWAIGSGENNNRIYHYNGDHSWVLFNGGANKIQTNIGIIVATNDNDDVWKGRLYFTNN